MLHVDLGQSGGCGASLADGWTLVLVPSTYVVAIACFSQSCIQYSTSGENNLFYYLKLV